MGGKTPRARGSRDRSSGSVDLCFSAEQQSHLERGWPHYRVLREGHPHDQKLADWLGKAVDASDEIYHVEWPVEVARGFVRAMGMAARVGGPGPLPATDPLTEQEVSEIFRHLVKTPTKNYEFKVWDLVLLLEAMVGGEVAADALLSAYESNKKLWKIQNLHDPLYAVVPLGYVLLRLGAARERFDQRIRALVAGPGAGTKLADFFGLIIGGREAAERHHRSNRLSLCHFVSDDRDFVTACAAERFAPFEMSARFVHLGGEEVLARYLPFVRKVPAWRIESFVAEMSVFRSPHVVGIFLLLAGNKRVQDRILEWCVQHQELARPALEAAAGSAEAAVRLTGMLPEKISTKKAEKTIATQGPKLVDAAGSLLAEMSGGGRAAAEQRVVSPAVAEQRFDELARWIATEIQKSARDRDAEQVVLEEARSRYAEIRSALGEEPEEAFLHFLGADGVGYERRREPPFRRVDGAGDEDIRRWLSILGDV